MAQHLIRHVGAVMVTVSVFCWHCEVVARDLPDPTRPSGTSSQGSAGNIPGSVEENAAPQLQSVIVSPERKVAIINGKTVRIGEKIGDAVVARITEGEVVLRSGKDIQTLKLFPGLVKRQDKTAPAPNKTTDDIKTR